MDRRSIGIINLGVLTDDREVDDMMSSRRFLLNKTGAFAGGAGGVGSGRNEQVALQDLLRRHIDENTMIKVPRVTVNFLSGPGNQRYTMEGGGVARRK